MSTVVYSLMSIDPRGRISAKDCIGAHPYVADDLDLVSAGLVPGPRLQ
jgi:hypothetical protein